MIFDKPATNLYWRVQASPPNQYRSCSLPKKGGSLASTDVFRQALPTSVGHVITLINRLLTSTDVFRQALPTSIGHVAFLKIKDH